MRKWVKSSNNYLIKYLIKSSLVLFKYFNVSLVTKKDLKAKIYRIWHYII